jgi:hypothetical protein
LDDGSAYIETSIATNETEKQNVNKNVDIKSGENPLEPSQADAHDVRLIKPFSFENLQNRDDEASLNVHELTLRQARSGDLKCNEAETAKQPTHGQSQPGDSQLATHEPVVNLQLQIQSMESKHAGEISDLQTKLQQAEKQRAEYQQNFNDTQEHVFSLQPRRSDITEDDAASEYSTLRVNVENWIESHLGAALDLDHKIFAQSKVDIASGSRLLALIEQTRGGAKSRDVPGTLPYYLRNAIMNFICLEIFQPELYDAVAGPWKFLQTIEASMRTLKPYRGKFSCALWQYVIVYKIMADQATLRAWRSETLIALIATADYQNARRQNISKLASALCGCLQVLLPRASKEQLASLRKSLAEVLIVPAMTLSEKFHVSAKRFSQNCRGRDSDTANWAKELEIYECRNLLDNGKEVRTLQAGVDCKYVIDICPGLHCASLKAETLSPEKQLKRIQILVAVPRPDRSYSLSGETALSHIYKSIQKSKR